MRIKRFASRVRWLLLSVALGVTALTPLRAAEGTLDICHIPPGKPENRKIMSRPAAAADAHLQRHGDSVYRAVEQCSGLVDDDCDGAVDCEDLDCAFDPRTDDETSDTFHCKIPECGDGFIDPGEDCDDGNLSNSDCCTDQCQFASSGQACGQADTCDAGSCDGVGTCTPDFNIDCTLPSKIDLPIAVSACAVPDLVCPQGDCTPLPYLVNPCVLESGEIVSCLEFYSTPAWNACWSVFDDQSPGVAIPDLSHFIEDAPITIDRSSVYLRDGVSAPVIYDVRNRMFDDYGGNPAGSDRYPDAPGIDSWVVRLPIIACHDSGDFCSEGSLNDVIGALCFEIREIRPVPDRIIAGRFLSPERDPLLYEACELGPRYAD